jgi:aspartate kinase
MVLQRVLKFGGAALADGDAVRRACAIVAAQAGPGPTSPRLVVVVSAHRGVTDLLETVARAAATTGSLEAHRVRVRHKSLLAQLGQPPELLDHYWRALLHLLEQVRGQGRLAAAELDLLLSFGERMSARVVARALSDAGVPATPVDAWDLGFVTDSNHGRARPLAGIERAIRAALADVPGVPVVTGFLAKDRAGNLTTLGRNGSDLTASVLADALGADEIQFWKTVGGILTADPELVPDARIIDRLTYDEAAELAFHGARILHPASVAPAVRARCAVRVCNVAEPDAPGTQFVRELRRAGPVAVASKRDQLSIELPIDVPERRGERTARFFEVLEGCGVTPGVVVTDGRRIGALVDAGPGVPAALSELGSEARLARGFGTFAIVGPGVGRDRALGLRALECLNGAGIEVLYAALGERAHSQAFVVHAAAHGAAVRVVHDTLLAPPARVG